MKIIKADFILTPNEIMEEKAVAFEKNIIDIDSFEKLISKYPAAEIIETPKNSILLPGLINSHVHLEFSANRASLSYGDFLIWLNSVIKKREKLIKKCQNNCLQNAVTSMLKSGTTAFGAISSYGYDMEICAKSPQRVVFFNEIIGSNPAAADILFSDFLQRLEESQKHKSDRFFPAVAVHSPYSVHTILAKKAIEVAKKNKMPISCHFMESKAEREWLDNDKGDFAKFFKEFLNQSTAANRPEEFLQLFEETDTLFVHAVHTNDKELEIIQKQNNVIVHCPVSNRLLGNGVLNIPKLEDKNITMLLATDGLSSNFSLNLFEEMKAALFLHPNIEPVKLAKKLIDSVTKNAAKALRLECGEIEKGKWADMIICELPEDLENKEDAYLHLILHGENPKMVLIGGEIYD
ncbi:aminofutalosine deaminase family hydrolase [Nitrosophilus alvini]|uniref:aminofutalosine deaminase family hydrolase n=1 Tax=Nitrosophilus alvini TaxID=2714855 RepID=UPI00190A1CE6|nr:metal-dependent hydrolase [Nitrosophilus alvini]